MACATLKRSLELDPLQTPRPAKRPRCIPGSAPTLSSMPCSSSWSSPFTHKYMNINRKQQHMSPGEIQMHCSEEMRRLTRRRQLRFGESGSASVPTSPSARGPLRPTPAASTSTSSNPFGITDLPQKTDSKEKDMPLFTFEQVRLICERMVREREEQLREIYEEALNAKLAEQYDAFVKFSHDHVQRHFDTNSSPPSYLS